ncbi:glutathione synthetase-like isoform X2 [Lutzomyia longipalpis]|nr:glutathione synthetase-like isoform X2 [Lutzomyia longipalpis]
MCDPCVSGENCCSVELPVLKPCIPIPVPEEQLMDVIDKAKDWALMHGAAMRSKTNFNPDAMQFAPFVLVPSSFPRKEFEKAVKLQTILNELMHKVAHDTEFLRSTLENTIKVDEFTGNLFRIYEDILKNCSNQAVISLGLLRSDYLAHCLYACCAKQVELNTIASSFGGISSHMTPMHSYILHELNHGDKVSNLPANPALSGLCNGMIEAWKIIGKPHAAILFIVENITYNICDQRFHEFEIRKINPEIRVIRKTLTEINKEGKLGPNNELLVNGTEVSVIYFRAGYEPGHYPTQGEWDARLLMERSLAIKCPSIHYHLAGTKKVQQALAKPGILKRFLVGEEMIESVKEIFTGLYSLDANEEGEEAVQRALKNPERYVLKPQREGGGNNIYGQDILGALKKMTTTERSAWILMERIFPPISKGYIIRPGDVGTPKVSDLVSELGIFGAIIGDKDKIVYNKQVGHMLRTKLATADEGGVAAGSGALDSPYLID